MAWDGVRVNVTSAGGTGEPVISEVRLYDTVGGVTNLVTGTTGAITASVSNAVSSSKDGDDAFDNDTSTRWECGDVASGSSVQFVQGLFTNNVTTIAEVGIVAAITFGSLIERHPIDGSIELRDSSTGTWSEVATYSGLDFTGGQEHRLATSTSAAPDGTLTHTIDSFTLSANAAVDADATLTADVGDFALTAEGNSTTAADTTLTHTVGDFSLAADSSSYPPDDATLAHTIDNFTLAADVNANNAPINADATLNKTFGTFVLNARTTKDRFTALYLLEDNQGRFYELTNFRPESDYPGGSPSVDMARGYDSLTMFVSSLDFKRTPQPWQWQGRIVATNNDALRTSIQTFLNFTKRTVKVVRTSDDAYIELYGVTDAIIVDPTSQVWREVTFSMLPKSLAWTRVNQTTYGEGVYGEGVYASNGLEELY